MYSFSDLEPGCCSMSSSNCCFLTCIQVSQEAGQVAWYSHLFQNFPQFIVIHRVEGFSMDLTEAEDIKKRCQERYRPQTNYYSNCNSYDLKDSPLVAQLVKNPPAMQETPVRFLGLEDPLEKGWATHSSIHGLPLWLSW